MAENMKTVFFGTPDIAVPYLKLLSERTNVVAVVSQPDRPSGRGLGTFPTPVKTAAMALRLKLLQPTNPSEATIPLLQLKPDLFVVVAYGRILKQDVLSVPRLGAMNAHYSLLPKYRGAAPVQWSLVRGERTSGVTLFWLDQGMDTGPIQAQRSILVDPNDDAPMLLDKLTKVGVQLLDEELMRLKAAGPHKHPQVGVPSMAPLIKKEDAKISFMYPAEHMHNIVRGFKQWPTAYFEKNGMKVQLLKTALPGPLDPPAKGVAGTILKIERGKGILVECFSRSRLWFLDVQPEGKRSLNAVDFANGLRLAEGSLLPFA